MITSRQRDLLEFLQRYIEQDGLAPTFDEMRLALNIRSKSHVHQLLNALEERGFIRRLANRARAIEILPSAHDLPPRSVSSKPTSHGIPVRSDPSSSLSGNASPLLSSTRTKQGRLRLWGKIAAGGPIEAIASSDEQATLAEDWQGREDHYALQIEGDSMIDIGIMDGDFVVIKQQQTCADGEIVVAFIEGETATLKRLFRDSGRVILRSENADYAPQIYPEEDVEIQGVLKGLIRQYG